MVLIALFSGQQWRNRESRPMDTERRRERVRYSERITWKLTIAYVKHMASGDLLYDSRNSDRGSVAI